MSEDVRWTRLRWRLRGATMWPAFVVGVIVDAALVHALPIAGETAPEAFCPILLAFFFNLVAVAIGAPLGVRGGRPAGGPRRAPPAPRSAEGGRRRPGRDRARGGDVRRPARRLALPP